MSSPDEYMQWLETVDKESQISASATRRVIENNQWQAEQVIANIAALHEMDVDSLAAAVLGNPT